MSTAKYNILIAEDNEASQALIARILEKAGYIVTAVNNGQEALDQLNSSEYDLCIIDMQMPVMGGQQTIREYREIYPNKDLPFIVLSADESEQTVRESKAAGAARYVVKPINSKDLLSVVESVLSGEKNSDFYSDSSIIDTSQLSYFDDPDFRKEFIRLFEESAETYISRLKTALVNNFKSYKETVHAIKGLSGNIGAKALRAITTEAENIDQAGYEKLANDYYSKIEIELTLVRKELVKLGNS